MQIYLSMITPQMIRLVSRALFAIALARSDRQTETLKAID